MDEAFADFVEGYESLAKDAPANVIVVRSFTKFYATAGLRLGYAVAAPKVAEEIRREQTPWSVGTLAQAAGVAVLADQEYARRTVAYVAAERRQWIERVRQLPGLHAYPGAANFLLPRLDRGDLTAPPWPSDCCGRASPFAPSIRRSTWTSDSSASPCGRRQKTRGFTMPC